ncbi:hypothetical protein BGZ68_006666 [Mortierella alpina]|nr:hypothetical protein BGZ68_006666 [Mortierella alpina]
MTSLHDPARANLHNDETSQQTHSPGNLANQDGATIPASDRTLPTALLTAAAATVQDMVQRIQSQRMQRQAIKEQVDQMMPMYLNLDQLTIAFYALSNNRDATVRLIFMKCMFQDQLDALKLEQYTITPENLSKLEERWQHYSLWVEAELSTRAAAAAVAGDTTNKNQVSGTGETSNSATEPTA